MQRSSVIPAWAIVPLLIAAAAVVFLRANGALHWDEPSYLYVGAYQTFEQIVAGQVQPSGIPGFIQGRILHVLQIKALASLLGTSEATFWTLVAIHLALIAGTLALAYRILRELLPQVAEVRAAVVIMAMSPVVIYMAGKTLADTEALAAATLATLGILRYGLGGRIWWCALAAAALAYSALTKNEMVFMTAGFCAAALAVPVGGLDRRRVLWGGVSSALGGALIAVLVLEGLGVGVGFYLSSYGDAFARNPPLAAKLMNIAIQFGMLWALLVVALIGARRRELAFLGSWLAVAMAPFVLLVGQIEPRHLTVNLVAAAGLFALALEVVNARLIWWRNLPAIGRGAVASLAVLLLMGSNGLALAVMPHEVEIRPLRALLDTLDQRYGAGRYTVLTPWGYSDFHSIRVLWPDVDVRDVGTQWLAVSPSGAQTREQLLAAYYLGRQITSRQELMRIGKPLVYLAFKETFSVENLRAISNVVAPQFTARMLGELELMDHRDGWLWRDPGARFEPVARSGHYLAYEVKLRP